MIKKIIKYFTILLLIVFLFFYNMGEFIYKNKITEKKELTEEQIIKFEKDIKEGKEIDINDYVVKETNYQNKITEINSSISHTLEKVFKKLFKHFLKNIDN